MKPRAGKGRVQWNGYAWLGAQLGATTWMAVGGIVLISKSMLVGCLWLFLSFMINLFGFVLYSQRQKLAPYAAIQMLLAMATVAAFLAWTVLVVARADLVPLMKATALQGYLYLLYLPALMGWFHWQEGIPLKLHTVPQNKDNDCGR